MGFVGLREGVEVGFVGLRGGVEVGVSVCGVCSGGVDLRCV